MLLKGTTDEPCFPLQEFGKERLLRAPSSSLAQVLSVNTAVWQCALAVWRLLGVADPRAMAMRSFGLLGYDWLAPGTLAKLAALQHLPPWQPSAAAVVSQCGGYAAIYSTSRLIGRLLFLQQEGTLHLLVADKAAARQQRDLHGGQPADAPCRISLADVAGLTDAKFCCLPGLGSSERYRAFMEQVEQLPAYQQLLAEGAAESGRLAALLPPELVPEARG